MPVIPNGTHLRLTIDGDDLSLETFLKAAQEIETILEELDRSLSGGRSVHWVVASIRKTSPTQVCLAPKEKPPGTGLGAQIARIVTEGLRQLESGTTHEPKHFSARALRSAQSLAVLRHQCLRMVALARYEDNLEVETATVTERVAASVREIEMPRYRNLGSAEGRLELLSIHNATKFHVYDDLTDQKIECRTSREVLEEIVRSGAFGKRVCVYGEIASDARGTPRTIDVESFEDFRVVRDRAELPQPEDIVGLYSDSPSSSRDIGDEVRREW